MGDITSLIERIEAATGGDRELDLAIHLALFPDDDIASITKYPRGNDHREGYSWDIYKFAVIFEKWTADGRCTYNGGYPLPCYSTSIDAALTLLPEGYAVTAFMIWPEEPSSATVVGTTRRPFGKDHRMSWVHGAGDGRWRGNGATAPLALLAAILRARQTEPRHDES